MDSVCDSACRENSTMYFIDPVTGDIEIRDSSGSTNSISPSDIPGLFGNLDCADAFSCNLHPMKVGDVIEGVYGDVAAVRRLGNLQGEARGRNIKVLKLVELQDKTVNYFKIF